jgi:hypothetical protein
VVILTDVSGAAALAICESLLRALSDRKILPEQEIAGVLQDAADSHVDSVGGHRTTRAHEAVAALINRIIDSRTSVRHP